MQSTSIVNRYTLLDNNRTGGRKRKNGLLSSSSYKSRKLRSTPLILTIDQISQLGKQLGWSTLQKADQQFRDPANLYLLKRLKLQVIHDFLLDLGLVKEKISMRLKQHEIAYKLIPFLYPGFPQWRAMDRGERLFRESNPSRAGLAYDLQPTCDSFERLEELVQINTTTHQPQDDDDSTFCVSIPVKPLKDYAQKRIKRKPEDKDIRLHMFLWLSNRVAWQPNLSGLVVDSDEKGQWTKEDQDDVERGYRHIDITEKVDWQSVLERPKGTIDLKCDCRERITQLSICTVWCKSPLELINHVYLQTASTHMTRALANTPRQNQVTIQRQMLDILSTYPSIPQLTLCETQALFDALMGSVDAGSHSSLRNDDDDDDDGIVLGDQSVTLLDTLLLTRIEYPARGIYCTHLACFDARVFFLCQLRKRIWKCYICGVQYKSIQDLYIDYEMVQALRTYPEEERLVYREGVFLPMNQPTATSKQAAGPVYNISAVDDEDDDDGYNKKRKTM